jgi:hypothetical protein
MIRTSSYGSRPYGEPLDPPDVPDVPVTPTPTPPVAPTTTTPTPVDTGSTGLPIAPAIPQTAYAPPTINTAQYQLPQAGGYGDDKQAGGGFGSPYVGTGWNNLSNFLNEENIGFGQKQQGEPAPMDLSTGRSQSQSDFENWMWNAGGKTAAAIPQNTGRTDGSIPIEPPSWGSGGGKGNPMRPDAPVTPTKPAKDEFADPWANFNRYTQNNRNFNTP